MSRYETFVIRVWIDDQSSMNHGEVRHPLTGAGRRFVRMEDALSFMSGYLTEQRDPATQREHDEEVPT